MRVHFVLNDHRADALEVAARAGAILDRLGIETRVEPHAAEALGRVPFGCGEMASADLVITFGGDGTLIRAAQECRSTGTPILGVFLGQFGFVTQCLPEHLESALQELARGELRTEDRMMVQTELLHSDGTEVFHSLNEAAVTRAATTRMLTFEVAVDGHPLTRYPADGVLVSTPTGSTAYNLSAGGPILDPRMEAMILTAITPHTLSARPLVLHPASEVRIRVQTRGDAVLSCDGQIRRPLASGDELRITRSPSVVRLVRLDDRDFLTKLRERLLWSHWMPGRMEWPAGA